MFSLFSKYPIITGISIVLALILASVIGKVNPLLGEILNMNMVFPFVVIGIVAILFTMLTIGKALLLGEVKKRKNRERALKARNSKD